MLTVTIFEMLTAAVSFAVVDGFGKIFCERGIRRNEYFYEIPKREEKGTDTQL